MKGNTQDTPQLQVRFRTKQEQYSVPDIPFSVPAAITTNELNTLIHALIKESNGQLPRKVVFDFLAGGEFLRTPLEEHIFNRNISSESILEVEYVERLPAPQPKDCLMHDDWVSAVSVYRNWILTGCYDSTLHLWTLKGKHKLTIPGHVACIKAVSWISSQDDTMTFVSGAHDQTALLWEWNMDQNFVECVHVCKGHTRSIECIGVNSDATRFGTGSYDTMLKIWSTSLEDSSYEEEEAVNEDGERGFKRPKKNPNKKSQIRTPLLTLQGHKEAISGISWSSKSDLVTSSWDHSLRLWDVQAGSTVKEILGYKCYLDVHTSPLNGLILTGSSDRHVRLYDPRTSEGAVVKCSFTSHSLWVQCVRWSSTNENLFMSGSYDQQVKLWDTRSPQVPLYDLSGHEDKVLCCDWSDPNLLVSGGADNTLRIFKARNVSSIG